MVISILFRSRFGFLGVLALIGSQLAFPNVAFANHAFRGRQVNVVNYGSGATIGTSDPYVGGEYSFELIRSATYDPIQRHVQTGWMKWAYCPGGTVSVFWEYFDGTNYINKCTTYHPIGDQDYYNEYDGTTLYWCHGYQGFCVNSERWTDVGFNTATVVTAYGETSLSSSLVQMGGPTAGQAVYISNIKYKPGSTTPPAGWGYIKTSGASYGSCGASPCPYGYNWGFAATVLYTYNWTY